MEFSFTVQDAPQPPAIAATAEEETLEALYHEDVLEDLYSQSPTAAAPADPSTPLRRSSSRRPLSEEDPRSPLQGGPPRASPWTSLVSAAISAFGGASSAEPQHQEEEQLEQPPMALKTDEVGLALAAGAAADAPRLGPTRTARLQAKLDALAAQLNLVVNELNNTVPAKNSGGVAPDGRLRLAELLPALEDAQPRILSILRGGTVGDRELIVQLVELYQAIGEARQRYQSRNGWLAAEASAEAWPSAQLQQRARSAHVFGAITSTPRPPDHTRPHQIQTEEDERAAQVGPPTAASAHAAAANAAAAHPEDELSAGRVKDGEVGGGVAPPRIANPLMASRTSNAPSKRTRRAKIGAHSPSRFASPSVRFASPSRFGSPSLLEVARRTTELNAQLQDRIGSPSRFLHQHQHHHQRTASGRSKHYRADEPPWELPAHTEHRPWFCTLTCAACTLVFVVEVAENGWTVAPFACPRMGPTGLPTYEDGSACEANWMLGPPMAVLDRLGAKNDEAIYHRGEWWRLCTSSWLHSGLFHLLLNMLGILSLGACQWPSCVPMALMRALLALPDAPIHAC